MSFRLFISIGLITLLMGCREEFFPEVEESISSVLVVEGYLDSEGKRSELRLSKSVSLGEHSSSAPETGALVYLLGNNIEAIRLMEEEEGVYIFEQDIAEDFSYQLKIELSNGEEYISEPIRPVLTPSILDAGYVRDEIGIEVFVNTQGDENADDFLWTYEETWVYLPQIRVTFIYKSDQGVVSRDDSERIDLCYQNVRNSDVLLETSSRFENQVVFRQTIKEFEEGDPRMQRRYSILISQKAIPEEAVEFWETLRRNSQDLGSIFSPLPSQIRGNIQSISDPDRIAIGQVSIGVVQQTRVYIDRADILPWPIDLPEFNECFIGTDTIPDSHYELVFGSGATLPARTIPSPFGGILGYYSAPRRCADCTLYANRERPDFWID